MRMALMSHEGYAWPCNLRKPPNEVTRMSVLAQDTVPGAALVSRRTRGAWPNDYDLGSGLPAKPDRHGILQPDRAGVHEGKDD